MLQQEDLDVPSTTCKISEDIWKWKPDHPNLEENGMKKEQTEPTFLFDPQDTQFQPEDQVFFKYVIRHSDGTLFEDSHEFYPYFPKRTEKNTGPCIGMRTAINSMKTGDISTFRFFKNAALSWTLSKNFLLDERYLDIEIEILAIESKNSETSETAFQRVHRTNHRAISFFKAKDFWKALFLFKTVEYNLAFLTPKLTPEDKIKSKALQAQIHSNVSQCFLNLREPHMALRELDSFEDLSKELVLNERVLGKAGYRKCMALTKTNRYEEAKLLAKAYVDQGLEVSVFRSIFDFIKEEEKKEELLFKKMFHPKGTSSISIQPTDLNGSTPLKHPTSNTDLNLDMPTEDEVKVESGKEKGVHLPESCSVQVPSTSSHEETATWSKTDDGNDDFAHYLFPEEFDPVSSDCVSLPPNEKEVMVPPPPPLHEILASLDMEELNRILHQFFPSKSLHLVSSLIQVLTIHSHEILYWSNLLLDQQHHLLEGVLRKLQDHPLIQFFDRTPLEGSTITLPTPLQFSSTTPILRFVDSKICLRFCLADSFHPVPTPFPALAIFKRAKFVQSYFTLVSLDMFHSTLIELFVPFDSYRVESMMNVMVDKLVVRPVVSLFELHSEKEALVLGYLQELCFIGKLDDMPNLGKHAGKPKLYVRGEENFIPLML